jgi:hypothetical protein
MKRQRGVSRDLPTARHVSKVGLAARARSTISVRDTWMCLGLMTLVALVYFPVHAYEFISLDDPQYVSANAYVGQGLTLAGLRWAFTSGGSFYWHPLTWLSHMLDVQLFGMKAGLHHVTNVAIHIASSVLLFAALTRMTGDRWRSLFVAAVFGVHPLHVESVAWVAERKDVLSTLFWMGTLYAYAGYVRDPRPRRMLVVTILFAGGLMAKPMIVTLPFALLLLDIWPLKRVGNGGGVSAWIPLVREKVPLFLLAVASVIVTLVSQSGTGAVVALEKLPLPVRVGNALVSYVDYLRDMVWPARLAAFYPLLKPSLGIIVLAAGILAGITVLVVLMRKRFPYLPIGWFWYVGTLLPVIGLVQAGDQGRADRFTYVPLIGLFVIIAWGATDAARRLRYAPAVLPFAAGLVIAASALVARHQVTFWKNDLTLWARTVEATRHNYRAEDRYGVALANQGRLTEAIEHYSAALAIWPDDPEAHNNLGTARMDQRRFSDAVHEFSEAARIKPHQMTFRYNLAVALDAAGRTPEAIRELQSALQLNPGNKDLLHALEVLGGSRQQ